MNDASVPALDFTSEELIGLVASVDTSRVLIHVSNSSIVTRSGVGGLIAIRGSTEFEFLIGITERVTRSLREELTQTGDDPDEMLVDSVAVDVVRVALVGTYRTVDGAKNNTFKRGADSFPQIDRECFVIEGANLQRFMGILSSDVPENERMRLGKFVADQTADAIANGDKFFQRHAAILGAQAVARATRSH